MRKESIRGERRMEISGVSAQMKIPPSGKIKRDDDTQNLELWNFKNQKPPYEALPDHGRARLIVI
jgi:hypothetical protein